jgi:transposase
MSKRDSITSPYVPDLDELKRWLEAKVAALKLVELVTAIIALVTRMRDINVELTKQLASLRRARPRSERLAFLERQLVLQFGSPAEPRAKPAGAPNKEKKSRRGRHPGRARPPAHLERIIVPNPVPPEMRICPQCGTEMTTVGHSSCEILEVIPARVVVIERRDERVACPHDDSIVTAPTPPELIERGKLGPALTVEAVAEKFIEHVPIERQCARFEQLGVPMAPQTLGRSVSAAIDLLSPLAGLVHQQTRGPGLLGTDTSSIPILDRSVNEGIRNGSMACWTNARWVSFVYSASGDAASIKRFLGEDFARTVQCDGASITRFIERAGGKLPGCWSHGRRGFVKAARGGDRLALDALHIIAKLFVVEKESAQAGDTAAQREARRQQYSKPVLEELRAWVDEQRGVIPPRTPLGQALGYVNNQWKRLCIFLENGHVELTNNRRERELRRLVVGRKNWLFTWEDVGGRRTADILTMIATCIAHDVNPRAYLHLAVRLIIEGWPQAKIRELLPDRIVQHYPELSMRRDEDDG